MNSHTKSSLDLLRHVSRWDIVVLILPTLSILGLLAVQSNSLWAKQHMQFFPLVYAAAIWFIYHEGRLENLPSHVRSRWAIFAAAIGIACAYVSVVIQSSWLGNLTFDVLLFAWCLGRFASLSVLRVVGICGLLLVALPPPFDLDLSMIQWLQQASTWISTGLLDVMGILHVQNGNVIEIQSKSLFVEEACSGVDSQYALMAIAGVLLLVSRAGAFVGIATVVTVPIWAILGNILRINLIVLGIEYLRVDLSAGLQHTLLGLVTFSLAAWAHWSSVQLLNWLHTHFTTQPESEVDLTATDAAKGSQYASISAWQRGMNWIAWAGVIPLLPLGLLFYYSIPVAKEPEVTPAVREMLPTKSSLPSQLLGCRQTGFDVADRDIASIFGSHSRIWSYVSSIGSHDVSLDLPFTGWHALWGCYERTGWTKLSSVLIQSDVQGLPLKSPFYEVQLRKNDGTFAILQFSLFDENGTPILEGNVNINNAITDRVQRAIRTIMMRTGEQQQLDFNRTSFQFQVLSRCNDQPNDQTIASCRELFVQTRDKITIDSLPTFKALLK
jgi:exosortase